RRVRIATGFLESTRQPEDLAPLNGLLRSLDHDVWCNTLAAKRDPLLQQYELYLDRYRCGPSVPGYSDRHGSRWHALGPGGGAPLAYCGPSVCGCRRPGPGRVWQLDTRGHSWHHDWYGIRRSHGRSILGDGHVAIGRALRRSRDRCDQFAGKPWRLLRP